MLTRNKAFLPALALVSVLLGTTLSILGGPQARPAPLAVRTPLADIVGLHTLARGDLLRALAGGADGTVYAGGYGVLLAYDPARQSVTTLSHLFATNAVFHSLAIAPDGQLYGLALGPKSYEVWWPSILHESFFVYDPQLREARVLDDKHLWISRHQVVAPTSARIYVFQEDSWQSFYDPSSGKTYASNLIALDQVSGGRLARQEGAVLLGVDKLVYVGFRLEVQCSNMAATDTCRDLRRTESPPYALMALDLTHFEADSHSTTSVTVTVPGPVQALAPRLDGGVYVSTQTEGWAGSLWSFDPTRRALTPLSLPVGTAPFATTALATADDGRLYGIGYRRVPASLALESFFFRYTPDAGMFEQLAALPGSGYAALLAMPGGRIYAVWQDQLLVYGP